MHTYTVELRIWSSDEDLDLKAITDDLGFAATNTRRRGELKSPSRAFTETMWGFEVHPGKEWDALEDGLESTLKILMPLKSKLSAYSSKYEVILWCGHFTSSFDGGPTFSREILKKLGDLGIPLLLNTYYSADN